MKAIVGHLDDKGRCCGRKPIQYKRDSMLFCDRCDRAYNMETGDQIENWAWMKKGDRFALRCTVCGTREGVMREWDGFPAGQQCDGCYVENVKKYESRDVANATGEGRGIPRTLDPIVGQSEVAE